MSARRRGERAIPSSNSTRSRRKLFQRASSAIRRVWAAMPSAASGEWASRSLRWAQAFVDWPGLLPSPGGQVAGNFESILRALKRPNFPNKPVELGNVSPAQPLAAKTADDPLKSSRLPNCIIGPSRRARPYGSKSRVH